jgi:hypothetical protein
MEPRFAVQSVLADSYRINVLDFANEENGKTDVRNVK